MLCVNISEGEFVGCTTSQAMKYGVWTAGQCMDQSRSESKFVWRMDPDSQEEYRTNYTNWASGEPDEYDNDNDSCLCMYTGDYKWNDYACDEEMCSVCEVDVAPPAEPP